MINNNKGVTLMSLVVAIVVMGVLITIVGVFSIDSIRNSYSATEKKELADIAQYVAIKKINLLNKEFNINDFSNDGQSPVITTEALYLLVTDLEEEDFNKIIEVNTSDYLEDNYKYVYITADSFNNEKISTSDIVVDDVKNNYIINFYTGTVIGLYDNGERAEISGSIKGLNDILSDIL